MELLIYIAILAGFLLVITNIFYSISAGSIREEVRAEVRQNLRFAAEKMTDEIRSSKEIISGTLVDGASGNTLDIRIADGTTTRFSVSGGILKKTEDLSLPSENVSDITTSKVTVDTADFVFSRTGNTIQINLKIDYNDNGRGDYKFSERVKTTVSLRL